MEERFELKKDEVERVKKALLRALEEEDKILFVYLHGSFGVHPFRDIDIGAYCGIHEDEVFDFELVMSSKLELVSGYPVDFKVINYAPIGFQFSVLNEGMLLFERDRTVRLDFLENTGLRYMDYFEFSKSYFNELMEWQREINIEKLKTLGKDLSDTISEIRTIPAIEEEVFLKNSKEIYALRYLLIEAVEAMANICDHFLARTTGQVPKGYPDCFEKLSAAKIITKELSGKLTKAASLRNILIHKYCEIDNRRVFRSTKENIGDFEQYLRQVNEFIGK